MKSKSEKVYLLKNENGEYVCYDFIHGWGTVSVWQFAYFFVTIDDAKETRNYLSWCLGDYFKVCSRYVMSLKFTDSCKENQKDPDFWNESECWNSEPFE